MPVETGRWTRTPRENRLCSSCNVIGDEKHYIYDCIEIDRTNLNHIPELDKLCDFIDLNTLLFNLDEYLYFTMCII